jgi:hypothetical protein
MLSTGWLGAVAGSALLYRDRVTVIARAMSALITRFLVCA